MAKILVVEDNSQMLASIKKCLEMEHHVVQVCESGSDAAFQLNHFDFDLIVLDWVLPDTTGIDVLRTYRATGGRLPVLMLTGQSTIEQKEVGLDSGADDYLVKPFDARELAARVRALLRRPGSVIPDNAIVEGDIILEPRSRTVSRRGAAVNLLPKELQLLEFFMRHSNEVLSIPVLLSHVWPDESDSTEEALRSTLKRLRRKLDPDAEYIQNIHGAGYVFKHRPDS